MIAIDLKSRKAIYEQVVDNFKQMIVSGVATQDTKVPSVREMARTLTVNPNTVQKAYRELERRGYFYTVPGQGSFVAAVPDAPDRDAVDALYQTMNETVRELLFRGETPEAVRQALQKILPSPNGGAL